MAVHRNRLNSGAVINPDTEGSVYDDPGSFAYRGKPWHCIRDAIARGVSAFDG
jgi:hypothetical protein